jgi:hypothetical protein
MSNIMCPVKIKIDYPIKFEKIAEIMKIGDIFVSSHL